MLISFKKAVAAVLAVAIPLGLFSNTVFAAETTVGENKVTAESNVVNGNSFDYKEYIEQYSNVESAKADLVGEYKSETESDVKVTEYNGEKGVLLWESGKGSISFEFDVAKAGLYNFAIEFLPLNNADDFQIGFNLDGNIPFFEAETLAFSRDWVNATNEPRLDDIGNELNPEQIMSEGYISRVANDSAGVVLEPFKFALTAGKHTVTLKSCGYPVAISKVSFTAPEVTKAYSEISKKYEIKGDSLVKPIVIHAENAAVKTDSMLVAKASNGDAGMYPVDPYLTKLNYIGGGSWSTPGQKIEWKFNVEKTGYYTFGARYKQNELVGGESWRWLKIDGKTPFDEAKGLRFAYGTDWQYYTFGDNKEPYYIYLEKGNHTVSLEVTLGELSEFYYRLNKVVTELGDMYLKIVMITGETPDVNRDYELFTQIPDFTSVLTDASKELDSIVKDMKSLSGSNGSQYTAAINNLNRVIKKMLDLKYISHLYVSDFYSGYTTVSSWLGEMKKMPLALDEMQFAYAESDFVWNQPSFFGRLWFGFKRLILSFTEDYSPKKEEKQLKIWVNWGRDQTMALDSLIKDTFTSKTGIKVELQLVSNSIINGLLANNFPDLQINLTRTDPVNYGMRGALTDLTTFPDYKEVLKRFNDGADIPYWYNGALYALPDTQTFYTMFYRTDVFKQMGLEVPKTWDEFLYCTTILQRYNMNVYVPYTQIASTTTVNAGIGSLHLYPTLMLQGGLNLYNEKQNATNITTPKGIEIFKEWTQMYTDYGYLKEADFYNRFRNGSMPLGIAPYNTYLTLYSAAPEIKGRWTTANVPGVDKDNNCVAGGGTGCSIVKRSKHQKEAWEFLKWWTSAETQIRYSNNVESILGMLGRVSTANVEAFKGLSWNPNDLEKLLEQFGKVRELPEVPGSYYLSRAVDQAFWAVINDSENPKDAITEWSKSADSEIKRKIKEYSKEGSSSQ